MALEIGRRFVHASGALVPGAYLLDAHVLETGSVTWGVIQTVAVAGLAVTAALETARLHGGLEHTIYDRLTREYERDSIAGYALYVVGATITVFAFEPTVAVPALFMLTLGDPISGMLSSDGLRPIARPRVLVGMFTVCFLIAYPFVSLLAATAGALGAALADGVKPIERGYVVDDNLTIPVVAASAMWAALAVA